MKKLVSVFLAFALVLSACSALAEVDLNSFSLDEIIAKYAVGWKLDRITRVDLSILRLAIYEIKHVELSEAVSVNEALELARSFSTPEAVSFINGVLGSMLRSK